MKPKPLVSGDSFEFIVVQPRTVLCPDNSEKSSAADSVFTYKSSVSGEGDNEEDSSRDSFPSRGFRPSLEGVPNEEDENYFKIEKEIPREAVQKEDWTEYNLSEVHLLERVALIVILQEASDQLTILRTLMKVGIYNLKADWQYKTLKEKYETDSLNNMHQPCTDQGKLYAHTYYLNFLIDNVIASMLERSDFRLWQELMDSSAREKKEEHDLIVEHRAYDALLTLVQSRLNSEKLNNDILRQKNNQHAFILEKKIHDQFLLCAIERRYVTGWECARSDQLELQRSVATSESIRAIDECARISAQEAEVTQSILNMQMELLEQTQMLIDDWMKKFDVDMEALDADIRRTKGKMEMKKEEYEEVVKEVARRQAMIDMWQQFTAEQDLVRAEKTMMDKNAVTIQCWWRGILVRNALGPYSRKTKGKGKSGKKGKAKKKY